MIESTGKRPFFGWRIMIVSTILMFIASGMGFYSHSVILVPLQDLYGWSRGIVSSAVTLFFFVYGVAGVYVGRKIDQIGSKPVLIIGAIIFSSGLFLLSIINQIWQLYLVYTILAIGFCCTALLPTNALITNWFIRRRGFALSLTMNGLSLGGMVLVPLMTISIANWGIKTTLMLMGSLLLIIFIPISLVFVVQRPADLDQLPDGDAPRTDAESGDQVKFTETSHSVSWTRAGAMKTLTFWSIVMTFLLAQGAQISFLIHQIPFLSQYMDPVKAGFVVSITTGASMLGRSFLGLFVDRYDKRYTVMICILLQAAVVSAMAFNQSLPVLYAGTFIFGLTMGSILMLQSLLIGDCFGLASFGTVMGISGLFVGMGSSFGPMLSGFIYDYTRSYQVAFVIFSIVGLVAAICACFARPAIHPQG